MKIGLIGSGNVATGLTRHLVPNGHEVMLSFSRDREKLERTASALGAHFGTVEQAVAFADVVVLATPWIVTTNALKEAGTPPRTKILWDCTNALKPDMSGLAVGTTSSGGEEVARQAPWAKVVKAIPPFAEVLHAPGMLVDGKRPGVFVCGDDAEARAVIARLVEEIGAEPFNCGPLSLARYTEPAGMLLAQLAYVQGFGARIGLSLIREAARTAKR